MPREAKRDVSYPSELFEGFAKANNSFITYFRTLKAEIEGMY